MDRIRNFRSPAGLVVPSGTIRDGCLYRSGHLGDATDGDLGRLEELGIRTIVDLRTDHDIESEGTDRVPAGVAHHHIPIEDEAGRGREIRDLAMSGDVEALRAAFGDGRGLALATEGAVNFLAVDALSARFRAAVEIVLDPGSWPVLWHCSAGKDRAGWVGTVALLAAGADDQSIVDHYLESNRGNEQMVAAMPDTEMRDLLQPFLLVQEDYVRGQLSLVRERWGSPEALLRDSFGIEAPELARYRQALIG